MPIVRGVICDNCGTMIYWRRNVSKQRAAAVARDDGWTVGKKCICPDCQKGMRAGKSKQ